jgi:hypothetical protein
MIHVMVFLSLGVILKTRFEELYDDLEELLPNDVIGEACKFCKSWSHRDNIYGWCTNLMSERSITNYSDWCEEYVSTI